MPYAASGSVEGCGLAPGPLLKLANWTGWVIFFVSTIVLKKFKLRGNEGDLAGTQTFGWSGYFTLFHFIGHLVAVVYGLYDLALGYEAGVDGPQAMMSYLFFLRQFGGRDDRSLMESMALYLPVIFMFAAWLAAYIVAADGAGIIVDGSKVPGCLDSAQEFLDTQDLVLKRSLPAVMYISNIALLTTNFAWRRGRVEGDIFFVWAGYIIFGVITLVLHLIDAFVGVGQRFDCGGYSVHSGLGYYNYQVNSYVTKDGATRQGHGTWYQAQNAFQS